MQSAWATMSVVARLAAQRIVDRISNVALLMSLVLANYNVCVSQVLHFESVRVCVVEFVAGATPLYGYNALAWLIQHGCVGVRRVFLECDDVVGGTCYDTSDAVRALVYNLRHNCLLVPETLQKGGNDESNNDLEHDDFDFPVIGEYTLLDGGTRRVNVTNDCALFHGTELQMLAFLRHKYGYSTEAVLITPCSTLT